MEVGAPGRKQRSCLPDRHCARDDRAGACADAGPGLARSGASRGEDATWLRAHRRRPAKLQRHEQGASATWLGGQDIAARRFGTYSRLVSYKEVSAGTTGGSGLILSWPVALREQ